MGKETALPKNIRQIGDIQGREKICIEDYVMTYIRKKEQQEERGYLGIFLGEQQESEDSSFVFIRGIFEIPAAAQKENGEETKEPETQWEELRQEWQKYFPKWEVQGCCVIGTYQTERMKELAGFVPESGKLIYHLQEQEESLYWTDANQYRRIRGYFVFYEQNRKMQEYLSEVFKDDSVEKESLPDKAIKSFREKVKEKGEKRNNSLLKLASSFFVITVLAIGAIVVNRVEDIRNVRNVMNQRDSTVENEVTDQAANETAKQVTDQAVNEAAGQAINESGQLSGSNKFWEEFVSDTDGEVLNAANVEANAAVQSEAESERVTESTETETQAKEASARQLQAAYVIKEGDTLANICKKYYGNFDRLSEICEANGISDANMILPGQKIVLP